jgi:hypothetical protein
LSLALPSLSLSLCASRKKGRERKDKRENTAQIEANRTSAKLEREIAKEKETRATAAN